MSRKVKNIIMITIIFIVCIASGFIIKLAKESGEYSSTISNGNATSKIKLTGDFYITSLEDDDTTYSNIDFNGYKLYVNGVAIN
ncbi:unknown [Clostridium sp. CAG:269]|nr:unknown [Clostridium sp. CAG:269]